MLGVQTHTLRYYERIGILEPSRSRGNIRLYSESDMAYVRQLKKLMDELGVNLAGVEVILRMAERISQHAEADGGVGGGDKATAGAMRSVCPPAAPGRDCTVSVERSRTW